MEVSKIDTGLPAAEELMQHWRKEADGKQIDLSFGVQEFAEKVFLFVTYPLKGNAPFGAMLLETGWELSIERFGGYDCKAARKLKRIMMTQYRIQVTA
ncbi:hypothetical protein [Paenibacillus sp. IHBB 3054]|uniref:hypothetical protein n=1 Tax=Paenibacillus sp. IHBB 3054 TaxID=3425689 RepID=UPI003F680CB9